VPLTTCRRRAPFLPPNHFPISNLASNSCPNPTQTTTTPSLSSLLLTPLPLPEPFLLTPTPFNLHNCLPTGGFLQTAVSDAPRTTSPNLPAFLQWGASDTALASIGSNRKGVRKATPPVCRLPWPGDADGLSASVFCDDAIAARNFRNSVLSIATKRNGCKPIGADEQGLSSSAMASTDPMCVEKSSSTTAPELNGLST
jgi:hypothetical protein